MLSYRLPQTIVQKGVILNLKAPQFHARIHDALWRRLKGL
jgi:hypothetical protein